MNRDEYDRYDLEGLCCDQIDDAIWTDDCEYIPVDKTANETECSIDHTDTCIRCDKDSYLN